MHFVLQHTSAFSASPHDPSNDRQASSQPCMFESMFTLRPPNTLSAGRIVTSSGTKLNLTDCRSFASAVIKLSLVK